MATITVFDSEKRRHGIVEALQRLSVIVQEGFYDAGRTVFRRATDNVDSLQQSLIVFRHFGDLEISPELHSTLTVLYGNNGPKDPRFDEASKPKRAFISLIEESSGRLERVQRRVDADGNLTTDEAQEILEFALQLAASDPGARLPKCLNANATKFECRILLPAIELLCETYLAVHVNPRDRKLEDIETADVAVVTDAVRRMDCQESVDASATWLNGRFDDDEFREKLRHHVRRANWWQILGQTHGNIEAVVAAEWGSGNEVACECVDRLVRTAIAGIDDHSEILPQVVANAYVALRDHAQAQ